MERERLQALVEYSQKVHVGLPLPAQTENCWQDLGRGESAAQVAAFKVYMIGYGESDCCINQDCGLIGQLVGFWGGAILMTQDIESAYSLGVRTVVDEAGEHFADRLVIVTNNDTKVKGIFRNLSSDDLEAALHYSLRRPPRAPSWLAILMDSLHAWGSNAPRQL